MQLECTVTKQRVLYTAGQHFITSPVSISVMYVESPQREKIQKIYRQLKKLRATFMPGLRLEGVLQGHYLDISSGFDISSCKPSEVHQ